jgi:hypothetical protein
MKKHSVVPNVIKILKEMMNLKVTWLAIPRKNDTFVSFAVMAHILKGTLINMF